MVAVRPDKRTIDASSGDFIVYAVVSSFFMTWLVVKFLKDGLSLSHVHDTWKTKTKNIPKCIHPIDI